MSSGPQAYPVIYDTQNGLQYDFESGFIAIPTQAVISRALSSASLGGAANEELLVAGLKTTSTIYSVTQSVPGANSVAMIGYTNDTNGSLNVIWTADPGVGAKVVVTFI